ncbi:uncharacterized protein LOC134837745 [Culicoides brevitarsis]|uniref:uncharacterized protein LOC134837745 n=1 Tax=Culicoides brevitarsis TaxID=469753 RepID=UPI00307C77DE
MGESTKKCIERWEVAVQKSNLADVKPEIERFIKKIGDNEAVLSNFTRKTFQVLIKHFSLENATDLVEILKYLAQNSPSYALSYFLPIMFNKTLELDKAKNYELGQHLATEFILDATQITEMTSDNIDFVMTIVQQWIFFHFKGGLGANDTLKCIVEGNVKLVLKFADSEKYLKMLDKFIGPTPNWGPALASVKGGSVILKNVLKLILSHEIRLNEATQKALVNNSVPKFIITALNLAKIDAEVFKSFDYEILELLEPKIPKLRVIKFMKEFCKLNIEPTIMNFSYVANSLMEILLESKSLITTPVMIESCLIVAKCLKPIFDALTTEFDAEGLMYMFKFTMNLIKVLMYCDSETDRGYCTECKNTKRHVADALIGIAVNTFENYAKRWEVNAELAANLVGLLDYKLMTADGLKCSSKERMIEQTLTRVFSMVTCDQIFEKPIYTKYKVKMAELFKKYSKNRTFKNLTPKYILALYSKIYNFTEFEKEHIQVSSLQILFESNHSAKKSRTDVVIKRRENLPEFENLSVLQILEKAVTENDFNLEIPKFELHEIILLEMEAIFNFSRNYARNVDLFNTLCELIKDPVIQGHALFLFEYEQHQKIDVKLIEKIETQLKKIQPKTMKAEIILGLIAMRKYTSSYNASRETLKDVKFFQNNGVTEETPNNFKMIQLELERPFLKLLHEAFEHFQMGLKIAARDNYKPLEDLYSCVKIRRFCDTISVHYEQRGLFYQAMEAQYLAYTIAKAKQDDIGLVLSLTHFVENLEQFKKLSKREPSVPKMTQELTELLEKLMNSNTNMALYKQGYIYAAYLSLASYYIAEGSCSKAIELLEFLQEPLHTCENKKYESYFKILRFKFYMLHQKMLLEYHPPSSDLSSMVFLFLILQEVNDMVEYKDEFHVYMPNLMFKMIEYLVWHQIARNDTKVLESYVILVFKIAVKKGLFLRCLQVYLTLTNMNMISENLGEVETHLSRMDQMLGNEPTRISKKSLVEVTPVKKPSTTIWTENSELMGTVVRREANYSPPPYIMSPPVDVPLSDFAKYMIQHDWKCKCIYCCVPQVKVFAFILGCFYARMLYLNANYTMAYQFYEKAVEYWMTLKNCVFENNDETLVKNFVVYSLYTHLHMCQCLMAMKKYDTLEHISGSLKDLLDLNLCENVATIEECNLTLAITKDLIKKETSGTENQKKFRSFESFVVDEDVQIHLTPVIPAKVATKIAAPSTIKSTKSIPIFVDGPKSAKMSPAQKKRLFFSKKKDTLESPSVTELSIDLEMIKRSAQKRAASSRTATLKKSASESAAKASTKPSSAVKRSTRIINKENDSSAKRPALMKKQLKFSPTLSSPVETVNGSSEKVKETPKSTATARKAAIKPKTITKSVSERAAKVTKPIPKDDDVIVIDSDSDTSVINASIPPPVSMAQLSAQRAKRYRARTAPKNPVKCDILVFTQSTSTIIEEFPDAPARFGDEIPASGLRCLAIKGYPENGCSKITPPPNNISVRHLQWCVVVARYNCSFEAKVRNAQAAGYDAVIVHNVGSNELEPMSANNDVGIVIPAVFVGEHTGRMINENYQWNEDFALLINNESPFNINTHLLLPFTVVVGLCFITMIVFTVVRCCRERRRQARHRLPKSLLKKIPTIKFLRGVHQFDTCAICLEDYVDGEKLRVLLCSHAYHCKCIDPWLTKNRRVCPMCKRKVYVRNERRPRRTSSDTSSSDADDTTPLLTSNDSQNDHGTFQQEDTPGQSSVTVSQWPSNSGTMSDDDELLDASVSDDQAIISTEPISVWQKFKRLFRRQPANEDVTIEDGTSTSAPEHVPSSSINFGAHSSNNLLNANLSGSFQRSAVDETTDDENILISSRQNRSAPNLTSGRRAQPTAGTSAGSSAGRIGVPAIPNSNQFNPSPPISRGRSNMIL